MLDIGKKIKELRQSKKMTQKDLAETLNVTPQAISKWERNKSNPDIQTLVNLSNYFNVTVDEILRNSNQSFFEFLFSKMKGSNVVEKIPNKIPDEIIGRKSVEKKIFIFDIVFSFISDKGMIQTQLLHRKLELLMKKRNKNIVIETYNSNEIDEYGGQADVILLTPTLGYEKKKIENKFSGVPVIVISKKDYGLLNAEILYTSVIDQLG